MAYRPDDVLVVGFRVLKRELRQRMDTTSGSFLEALQLGEEFLLCRPAHHVWLCQILTPINAVKTTPKTLMTLVQGRRCELFVFASGVPGPHTVSPNVIRKIDMLRSSLVRPRAIMIRAHWTVVPNSSVRKAHAGHPPRGLNSVSRTSPRKSKAIL
eukprot:3653440-Pyramimonas_sp.AAC.1